MLVRLRNVAYCCSAGRLHKPEPAIGKVARPACWLSAGAALQWTSARAHACACCTCLSPRPRPPPCPHLCSLLPQRGPTHSSQRHPHPPPSQHTHTLARTHTRMHTPHCNLTPPSPAPPTQPTFCRLAGVHPLPARDAARRLQAQLPLTRARGVRRCAARPRGRGSYLRVRFSLSACPASYSLLPVVRPSFLFSNVEPHGSPSGSAPDPHMPDQSRPQP